MPTPEQIERIAAAANALRPEWPIRSLITYLSQYHSGRPYRDLAAALAYVATDTATKTPKRLGEAGPWWRIGDAQEATPDPGHPVCPTHGTGYPCPTCRTETVPMPRDFRDQLRAALERSQP